MTARSSAAQAAEKWARMPCLGFDLETTGINPHEDRIVTAALVDMPGEGRPAITSWLTDPGIPIPEGAAAVHGWTTEKIAAASHKIDAGQMLFEVTGRLARALGHGKPVVGMNLAYDLTMLEAENARHDVDTLASRLPKGIAPVVDVLVLDKAADPYRKGGRKLVQLCGVYKVAHVGAHDAGGDALAACRLWPRIMAAHPGAFRGMTLPALHLAQRKWRHEQQQSLRAYFDRAGKPHDGCCGEWPVHSTCAPAHVGASA